MPRSTNSKGNCDDWSLRILGNLLSLCHACSLGLFHEWVNFLLDFHKFFCYIIYMIKNKTKHIEIHEWTSFISVKIHEGGEFPRVRSTGLLSGLNRILKEELSRAKELGVEISISRTGCGKFGGVKWQDIGKQLRAWLFAISLLYYRHMLEIIIISLAIGVFSELKSQNESNWSHCIYPLDCCPNLALAKRTVKSC